MVGNAREQEMKKTLLFFILILAIVSGLTGCLSEDEGEEKRTIIEIDVPPKNWSKSNVRLGLI